MNERSGGGIAEPPPLPSYDQEPRTEVAIPISRERQREELDTRHTSSPRHHELREEIDLADLNRNFPRPHEMSLENHPAATAESNGAGTLENLKHQLTILESALNTYHERIGKLQEQEQQIQTFLAETQEYLEHADSFLSHPDAPQEHVEDVRQGSVEARAQFYQHQEKLADIQKTIGNDDSFRSALKEQTSNLEGRINEHENRKAEVKPEKPEQPENEKGLTQLNEQIRDIESRIADRQQQLTDIASRKEQIKELVTYNRDIAGGADNPKDKLTKDLKGIESQVEALNQRAAQYTEQKDSLEEEYENLSGWEKFLENFGIGNAERIQAALATANRELPALLSQVRDLEHNRDLLTTQLNTVNERLGQISELGGSEVRLTVEESAIKEQIKALTTSLGALKSRREGLGNYPETK